MLYFLNWCGVKICYWSSSTRLRRTDSFLSIFFVLFFELNIQLKAYKKNSIFETLAVVVAVDFSICYILNRIFCYCCLSWKKLYSFLLDRFRHDDSPLQNSKAQDYFRFHQHFFIYIFFFHFLQFIVYNSIQ